VLAREEQLRLQFLDSALHHARREQISPPMGPRNRRRFVVGTIDA
jgi:hypothetical protein